MLANVCNHTSVLHSADAGSLAEVRAAVALDLAQALKVANTTATKVEQAAYPPEEVLPYPPAMPEASCICRLKDKTPQFGPCPSPWSAAGTSQASAGLCSVA